MMRPHPSQRPSREAGSPARCFATRRGSPLLEAGVERDEAGFGLLVIVMGILGLGVTAGVISVSAKFLLDNRNIKETQGKLRALASAISSTTVPGLHANARHYEQDVGALPAALADLTAKPGAVAACAIVVATRALGGWCGPYWTTTYTGESTFADGWGNTIVYSTAPRQLRSAGPNGVDNGGGGDDLVQAY